MFLSVFLSALLAAPSPVFADRVKLTNGSVHEGTILEETDEAVVIQSEGIAWTLKRDQVLSIVRDDKGRAKEAARARTLREQHGKEKRQPEIVMYGTTWCGACRQAREYFTKQQMRYVFKDVEKDPQAAFEFSEVRRRHKMKREAYPTLVIGEQATIGFDPAWVTKALKKKRK